MQAHRQKIEDIALSVVLKETYIDLGLTPTYDNITAMLSQTLAKVSFYLTTPQKLRLSENPFD